MTQSTIGAVLFYFLAAVTIAGAAGVAFSRNIVRSAFALLATFAGVAGLYAWISADVMAVIQLLVYVGGVLVLILFAVMLTSRISDVRVSNRAVGSVQGLIAAAAVSALAVFVATRLPWHMMRDTDIPPPQPTAAAIGDALLGPYVLPFEIVSVLLLAALVGAVTLAGGRKTGGGSGGPGGRRE